MIPVSCYVVNCQFCRTINKNQNPHKIMNLKDKKRFPYLAKKCLACPTCRRKKQLFASRDNPMIEYKTNKKILKIIADELRRS
jgi:hypothetical protein